MKKSVSPSHPLLMRVGSEGSDSRRLCFSRNFQKRAGRQRSVKALFNILTLYLRILPVFAQMNAPFGLGGKGVR